MDTPTPNDWQVGFEALQAHAAQEGKDHPRCPHCNTQLDGLWEGTQFVTVCGGAHFEEFESVCPVGHASGVSVAEALENFNNAVMGLYEGR